MFYALFEMLRPQQFMLR